MRISDWSSDVCSSDLFRSGDATLSGTLYLPDGGQALGAVVVTHSASKPLRDALLYQHLTEMLPPLGIAVLTYDRRGSGRSEEHTSELQSLMRISYAVFCLKKKKKKNQHHEYNLIRR